MNERYEELIRRAVIDDDTAALDELMELGQLRDAARRFEDASKIFRALAGAYRLRATGSENRGTRALSIYHKWFDANLCDLRDWSNRAYQPDDGCIRNVIVGQLWGNEQFTAIFAYLEEVLTGLGMQFYSPGGSVPRRVSALLAELFGGEKRLKELSRYLDNRAVRVGLDLLAVEVLKRCGGRTADEP